MELKKESDSIEPSINTVLSNNEYNDLSSDEKSVEKILFMVSIII